MQQETSGNFALHSIESVLSHLHDRQRNKKMSSFCMLTLKKLGMGADYYGYDLN